jgi:nucleotide-binding universal stress UspA family protein
MFRKIMVAYDESPEAARALSTAIELAKEIRAELSVVTVLEPLPAYYSFAVLAEPSARSQADDAGLPRSC